MIAFDGNRFKSELSSKTMWSVPPAAPREFTKQTSKSDFGSGYAA